MNLPTYCGSLRFPETIRNALAPDQQRRRMVDWPSCPPARRRQSRARPRPSRRQLSQIAILAISAVTTKRDRASKLLSSPALNRFLLVGSEVLQIHQAVNRRLVG